MRNSKQHYFYEGNENENYMHYGEIAGETISLLYKGDSGTMLPPEEYIRQLWEVNKNLQSRGKS